MYGLRDSANIPYAPCFWLRLGIWETQMDWGVDLNLAEASKGITTGFGEDCYTARIVGLPRICANLWHGFD